MKRTPLARSRKPIRRVSAKRAALIPERQAFNRTLPEKCQIMSPVCGIRATCWHEAIKRSANGAIVPGDKATAQGQVFWASCVPCNGYLEDHPRWGVDHGFVIRKWPRVVGNVAGTQSQADLGSK